MNAKQYIREIVQRSCLPKREHKKLKADLESEINAALERGESIEQIIERMGDPDKIAAELYENYAGEPLRPFFEYKSEMTLFGLPLVHIIRINYAALVPNVRTVGLRGANIGGRYNSFSYLGRFPTARGVFAFGPKAKGIFAVGNFSTGFISIGNLSAGLISIGNVSTGLFTIGNFALALLLSLGNLTAGALSAGNLALGYGAAGNCALGEYAIGNKTVGTHTFTVSDLPLQFESIKMFLRGLNAPGIVKEFFGYVEKTIETIIDPSSAIPLIITLSLVLLAVILLLCIIPNRLLKRKYEY